MDEQVFGKWYFDAGDRRAQNNGVTTNVPDSYPIQHNNTYPIELRFCMNTQWDKTTSLKSAVRTP